MTYKLWIDDDAGKPGIADWRNPPSDDWKVAHSSAEAVEFLEALGLPSFIDFDHDLGMLADGTEDTSMKYLRYIEYSDYMFGDVPSYRVHSQNPGGAANIHSFMESWKKSKDL